MWRVLVVLTTIKAGVLILDSTVRLYLGDSAAYLAGAQYEEWLPTDRSFTYSLFLGAFVWPAGRLQALLVWQALAGVAVACLLWHVLRSRFHAPRAAAAAAACALALEPAQLYLERMVLAETLGFLAFAGFFASASAYLARPRPLWLPLVAALGLAAATLRMNYLPVVLVVSLALPMLLLATRARPPHRTVLAHALLAVCSVLVLHAAYRQTVAVVFDVPAAYLPRTGFMQLGLVAPLVTSAQLERVGLPSGFERRLRYPLADRRARMAHMWRRGGLTQTLRAHGFDVEEVARPLSRMALVDNPFGLVPLGVATVGDYFRPEGIRHALHNDLGRRAIPGDLLRTLRDSWGYEAEGLPARVTFASAYYERTHWWLVACLCLLLPLSAWNAWIHWRTPARAQALLAAMFGVGLVLSHVLFVNVAFFRYLHPMPFFVLLNAVAAAHAVRRARGLTSNRVAVRFPIASQEELTN